tara:strand:- start:11 stop:664 length:654 start_codon:yes stop_codon:yes gene_type:complete
MIVMQTKKCNKCGEEKVFYSYSPDKSKPDGLNSYCKECRSKMAREYRKAHPERITVAKKKYYKANKKDIIAKQNAYDNKRYADDPKFAFIKDIRARLNQALGSGSGSGVRDLGCSVDWVMDHLASQFEEGMTWENRSKAWVVDHMYPLSAVDHTDRAQVMAVCNWRNLQPLTPYENGPAVKGDKIYPEHRRLFDGLVSKMRTREEGRSGMDASGSHC